MARHRLRFTLCMAVLFVAAGIAGHPSARTLLSERTFFGVLRVVNTPGKPFRIVEEGRRGDRQSVDSHDLFHGTTRHGRQMQGLEMDRRGTSYYHPTGPIGKIFRTFQDTDRLHDVAVIGLGVGSLASYGRSGQTMTFFEIDPAVVRIAHDPDLFTYLRDSSAEIRIRVGDGRILLSMEPDASYDLVVVDGFTSDAIPAHLLTVEAFEIYLRKLSEGGILALHITSEHLDLLPLIRAIADEIGIQGLWWDDEEVGTREEVEGKSRSVWAVLSRDPAALDAIRANGDWRPLSEAPAGRVWTDTLSSPLSVLK